MNREGDSFPVHVKPFFCVAQIKGSIEASQSIPVAEQVLHFGEEALDDSKSLEEYGISHDDTLSLDRMRIYVKKWEGINFPPINVDPTFSVERVKQAIAENEDIPIDEQVLRFEEEHLNDPRRLHGYGIAHEDTLLLDRMNVRVEDWQGNTFPIYVNRMLSSGQR
jgi:hypothetical protein